MQSLTYGTGTGYLTVYPEVTSSLASDPSGSFVLEYIQDYDQTSGSIDLTLLNTPNRVNPRLTFSLDRSQLPEYTGYYTVYVKEGLTERKIWGSTNIQWSAANFIWSDQNPATDLTTLDTDRAWISGSDVPAFTQYESPDEDGRYKTYHG